jgi:serine/threonine protein kinase
VTDEKRIRSFEDLIAEEGLLPLARTVDLVAQIAEAMAALKAEGGVIDALEPRAVLVMEELVPGTPGATRTRVLGIRSSDELPVRPGGPRASYVAPENLSAPPGQGGSDLANQFSLATIAYEMLAGCPAYPEEIGEVTTVGEPDDKGWARPMPPPVSELVMGVSSGLDQVLRRALSTDPNQRYSGINEFVAALREVSDPGAVWDDGATVIWSPAAGDMEPAAPPPMPIDERAIEDRVSDERGPWLQPRTGTTAKLKVLRLSGAARYLRSKADALLGRNKDPSLRALMRKSRSTPPRGAAIPVPASGPATPMSFASFPISSMPTRKTQMIFLGAAVVLVLGAVGVMAGSRSKPATDNAASESVMVEPEPTIKPRPRIVEPRPAARPAVVPSAAAAGAQHTATIATIDPPKRASKPARTHSRRSHRQGTVTARR